MLPELALAADTNILSLEVRLLGNVQDDFAGNDQSVQRIVLAQSDFWTMTLNTDTWANEISWRIENSEGEAIMSGGDYPINVATYESSGCVPVGCYTLIMEDTNGDGLCSIDFGNDGTCDIGGSMSSRTPQATSWSSWTTPTTTTVPWDLGKCALPKPRKWKAATTQQQRHLRCRGGLWLPRRDRVQLHAWCHFGRRQLHICRTVLRLQRPMPLRRRRRRSVL